MSLNIEVVLNLKQNSMARRHALFPSAMPFFSAPCVQNVPFLTKCYYADRDAIYVLVHGIFP